MKFLIKVLALVALLQYLELLNQWGTWAIIGPYLGIVGLISFVQWIKKMALMKNDYLKSLSPENKAMSKQMQDIQLQAEALHKQKYGG